MPEAIGRTQNALRNQLETKHERVLLIFSGDEIKYIVLQILIPNAESSRAGKQAKVKIIPRKPTQRTRKIFHIITTSSKAPLGPQAL
eukprot:8712305-Pyramimonas_sp.AAC.1